MLAAIATTAGVAWTTPAVLHTARAAAAGTAEPGRDTTLAISKTGPIAVFNGQQFEFSIEVTNTGSSTATGVVVVDDLPDEGNFVSSTPSATPSGGTLTVPLGSIPSGTSSFVTVRWRAPESDTTLVNAAAASADNATQVSDDHSVSVGISGVVTGGVTAAGTGLRNRDNGDITISGVPAGAVVTRAVLVWAVLYDPPVPSNQITFQGVTVTADLTQSVSGHLCWGDDATVGYAADVTHLVAGNGVYAVTDPVNGLVREDADPVGLLPYTDGASLFVFYGGPGFDAQVVSDFTYTAGPGTVNTRVLGGINSTGGSADLYLAGPDGQASFSEAVVVTGAGPSLRFDDTWDGSDPQEGPDFGGFVPSGNLWDTDVHDVSSALPAGQTTLRVDLGGESDCVGLSGVALQVEQ